MTAKFEGIEFQEIIPAGSYTTDDVLAVMARYAIEDYSSREIQDLAASLTYEINVNDTESIMIAIRNWILSNMKFVKDNAEAVRLFGHREPDLEMVKSPLGVLGTKRYDCDCISSFIASLLLALGIPARFVAVSFYPLEVTGSDGYSHVFCQGYNGNKWITIDPVSYPNEARMLNDVKQWKPFDICF